MGRLLAASHGDTVWGSGHSDWEARLESDFPSVGLLRPICHSGLNGIHLTAREGAWKALVKLSGAKTRSGGGEHQRGRQNPSPIFFAAKEVAGGPQIYGKTSRSRSSFQTLRTTWAQAGARLLEEVPPLRAGLALCSPGAVCGAAAVASYPSNGLRCPEMWSSRSRHILHTQLARGRWRDTLAKLSTSC